jgi:ribosomal protein S27AE
MSETKNPHTGSTFDSFLEEEGIEILEKKCPRCGGASANKSNPAGRCSACLKKLSSNKKKPGHWQRAQTKADDALRRQKGKNGTAHKKSKGLGSRASIVKQTQSAEKKTGEKLSPDRKNNSEGYASSNTRMVPEKLNRGRHHVDPKKLKAWKKRMKKSEIDIETLYTLMKANAQDYPELAELLKNLGPDGLENYINAFDTEE